ncbi:fucose isomerase, partial [bacterium]|nr:fucose isomerase [bacterium]
MAKLINTPTVKLGIVGVSRDCFLRSMTEKRLKKVMTALRRKKVRAYACTVIIENEVDALAAIGELLDEGCNAAVIYLGNFGPEGPTTIFADRFPG